MCSKKYVEMINSIKYTIKQNKKNKYSTNKKNKQKLKKHKQKYINKDRDHHEKYLLKNEIFTLYYCDYIYNSDIKLTKKQKKYNDNHSSYISSIEQEKKHTKELIINILYKQANLLNNITYVIKWNEFYNIFNININLDVIKCIYDYIKVSNIESCAYCDHSLTNIFVNIPDCNCPINYLNNNGVCKYCYNGFDELFLISPNCDCNDYYLPYYYDDYCAHYHNRKTNIRNLFHIACFAFISENNILCLNCNKTYL